MSSYFRLYPRQTERNAWLFRLDKKGAPKIVIRPDVAPCKSAKCRKFDEIEALEAGAYNRFRIKSKEDFIATREMFPSGRLKAMLTTPVGEAVSFYPLDPEFDFWVALPKRELIPDPKGGAVRPFGKCPVCGRFSELVWGKAPVAVTERFNVAFFHLENKLGMTPVWIVAEPIARALLEVAPKFKGIVTDSLKTAS